MNIEQIENGEPRIFPYYRDIYLGNNKFGFSTIQSAKKYMNKIPKKVVYEEMGLAPEEYVRRNFVLYPASTKDYNKFLERTSKGIKTKSEEPYLNKTHIRAFLTHNSKEYAERIVNEIIEHKTEAQYFWYFPADKNSWAFQFFKSYKIWPHYEVNWDDYKEAERKLKKNIEYRKGIIKLSVEFIK